MDNSQLYILAMSFVAIVAMGVAAYANATRRAELGELITLVRPFIDSVFAEADSALAPYGDALRPVHAGLETAAGLFDEDSDALVQKLKNDPAVIAAIRVILAGAVSLTDGVPEAPPAEPGKTYASVGPTYAASEAIKHP